VKLEDMKKIAAKRSKGKWSFFLEKDCHFESESGRSYTAVLNYTPGDEKELFDKNTTMQDDSYSPTPLLENDAEFFVMAANTYDKFIKLAEAAKALTDYTFFKSTKFGYSFNRDFGELKLAVEDLEKE
jgi:hypothetical protein